MGLTLNSRDIMSDTNVYVSISKQADKEVINKVLQYLSCFDINVYTYDGKNYDKHDLDIMDYMIVITPETGVDTGTGIIQYEVGKGQYTEIDHFQRYVGELSDVYVVSNLSYGIHVDELTDMIMLHGSLDWNKWANLRTYGQCINLNNYNFRSLAEYDALCEELDEVSPDVHEQSMILDSIPSYARKFYIALTRRFLS